MSATAVISECGRHRYRLTRTVESEGTVLKLGRVLFLMLNPSTATAETDDATIRKCKGFARRWGYRELEVVNLFSFRATKPKDLWASAERNTTLSDFHILAAIADADKVVLAYGYQPKAMARATVVEHLVRGALLPGHDESLWCIGGPATSTASNAIYPRHPVMITYELPLLAWPRRAA